MVFVQRILHEVFVGAFHIGGVWYVSAFVFKETHNRKMTYVLFCARKIMW